MNPAAPLQPGRESPLEAAVGDHSELFAAVDHVLNVFQAGGETRELLAAMDILIGCASDLFSAHAISAAADGTAGVARVEEIHGAMLEYMENLRSHVARFDTMRFLPQMRFLDYWLTTHISERGMPTN